MQRWSGGCDGRNNITLEEQQPAKQDSAGEERQEGQQAYSPGLSYLAGVDPRQAEQCQDHTDNGQGLPGNVKRIHHRSRIAGIPLSKADIPGEGKEYAREQKRQATPSKQI